MQDPIKKKQMQKKRRAHRTRSRIRGTQERPRLTVFRSRKYISAQVIDDTQGKVIAQVGDVHIDTNEKSPVEIASLVGAEIAKRATAAGVKKIVFDRGAYLYHGRVKALADAAREHGLEF